MCVYVCVCACACVRTCVHVSCTWYSKHLWFLQQINNVEVLRVLRNGATAVHFTATPLAEGDSVHMSVDWKRRFDHMQQHSGQHLITAIADILFGYKTTSWWVPIAYTAKNSQQLHP